MLAERAVDVSDAESDIPEELPPEPGESAERSLASQGQPHPPGEPHPEPGGEEEAEAEYLDDFEEYASNEVSASPLITITNPMRRTHFHFSCCCSTWTVWSAVLSYAVYLTVRVLYCRTWTRWRAVLC